MDEIMMLDESLCIYWDDLEGIIYLYYTYYIHAHYGVAENISHFFPFLAVRMATAVHLLKRAYYYYTGSLRQIPKP